MSRLSRSARAVQDARRLIQEAQATAAAASALVDLAAGVFRLLPDAAHPAPACDLGARTTLALAGHVGELVNLVRGIDRLLGAIAGGVVDPPEPPRPSGAALQPPADPPPADPTFADLSPPGWWEANADAIEARDGRRYAARRAA